MLFTNYFAKIINIDPGWKVRKFCAEVLHNKLVIALRHVHARFTGYTKKVPSIEIRCFVLKVRCDTFESQYNYSTIHVQVNSIPKGVTTHVQNKTSDFNRGLFLGTPCIKFNHAKQNKNLLWSTVYYDYY